jgi:glutathione S-transferase
MTARQLSRQPSLPCTSIIAFARVPASAIMPYTLYYHPNTASLSTHWVLVELEMHRVQHSLHLVDFPNDEQSSAPYLSLNPKGRVPTLVLDDNTPAAICTESSAILQLLAEAHPEAALIPAPGSPSRVRFLTIYAYITNQLLPALRDWVYADKDGEDSGAKGVRALAAKRIKQSWAYLNEELEGRKYLVDDGGPSIADYLAAATVSWTKWVEKTALAEENANIRRWCEQMRARDSWNEVVKQEPGWVVRAPPFEKDF